MDQQSYQLKLPEPELRRLGARVWQDYRNAISDHQVRIGRFREFFRRWRARTDMPDAGEEEASNYPVPVIRWNVEEKWAQNADAIFGDEAEIVAKPVGPSDYRNDKKIGLYMTWRVFNDMKITNELLKFELYKILYGRAIAYSPWERKSFEYETSKGTAENVYYKGPGFEVLEVDDFVCPAEDTKTLHDFSWIVRKVRLSPEQLLTGEEEGRYQGIKENFEQILMLANKRTIRDYDGDEIKRETDDAEGVTRESALSSGNRLLVLEWYGKWRQLKQGKRGGINADAGEWNVKARDLHETEIVVRFIPDLNLVVGVQDLSQLYPAMPNPRPFVEASYKKDGSYWCDGLAAMLIDSEDELRNNHNLGTDAQQYALTPLVLYRPGRGMDPQQIVLKPKLMVPVDNPATDVHVLEFNVNLEAIAAKEQTVLAYVERLTGMTDMAMGRQPDRPNAPRTARGTMALLQQGNLRMTIDTVALREDYAQVFQHFWMLEWMFLTEETFFRVTEDDANGLFPVEKGGSKLSQVDRNGRYDFRLELASSQWSREAEKENVIARYQIDLQNPLILNNPVALWRVTNEVHKALGDPNFADLVPEPPTPDAPINPKEEWARIQQGELIQVNPMDNDQLHLTRHAQDLQRAIDDHYDDQDAIQALKVHYINQVHQLQQKVLVQAITERMVQQAAALGANPAAGLNLPPGIMAPPGGTALGQPMVPIPGSAAPPINPTPFKGQPPKAA